MLDLFSPIYMNIAGSCLYLFCFKLYVYIYFDRNYLANKADFDIGADGYTKL